MSRHTLPPDFHVSRPPFPALDVRGKALACQRGGRMVFRHLDVHVTSGDAVLLLGPNGSGKSSLLRMLAGFLPVASGCLEWGQADQDRNSSHSVVRYLGHLDALKPALTVRENIVFWCHLLGKPVVTVPSVDSMALYMGISHLLDLPGRFLSAGQRRRVAMMPLVLSSAPLWLMDEPATALDAGAVHILEKIIAAHRAHGGAIVLSTHTELDVPDARVIRLDDYAPSLAARSDDPEVLR